MPKCHLSPQVSVCQHEFVCRMGPGKKVYFPEWLAVWNTHKHSTARVPSSLLHLRESSFLSKALVCFSRHGATPWSWSHRGHALLSSLPPTLSCPHSGLSLLSCPVLLQAATLMQPCPGVLQGKSVPWAMTGLSQVYHVCQKGNHVGCPILNRVLCM